MRVDARISRPCTPVHGDIFCSTLYHSAVNIICYIVSLHHNCTALTLPFLSPTLQRHNTTSMFTPLRSSKCCAVLTSDTSCTVS